MKYFLWVLGCAMNYSDAERIATVFNLLGYKKTENETEADVIITIACSVRQTAIDRIYGKAKKWKELRKKNKELRIFLTGCVLDRDLSKMKEIFDNIFKIEEMGKLTKLLEPNSVHNSKSIIQNSGEYLNIYPNYNSPFRAYVPIMTGCNNFCSYCAVPYTRGREKSRPEEEIVAEVKSLVKKGYKEITLLGQNVNSYKGSMISDKENQFVKLLKKIDKIEGEYRVYFYSNHPKDMSDELIEILPKLRHFPAYIHLPLQSGNDEIIKKMNRHYTKKSYLDLVVRIKKSLPEVTLTTDIIVGFPGETEAAFTDTVEVMKEAEFDMAFIAQYSPRLGTKAAKFPDNISKEIKKIRDKALVAILEETAQKNNQKIVGTRQKVLVDGEKSGKFYGRTEGYKVVEIKTGQSLTIGQFLVVEIESATAWKMTGKI